MKISIDIFGEGSIWRDRIDEWKVLANDGKNVIAVYITSGAKKLFNLNDVELVKKIHDNIRKEEEDKRIKVFGIKQLKVNVENFSNEKLYFTLGFLARNGFLEIRTVPNTDSRDNYRYFNTTGKNFFKGMKGYEFDICPTTWATKLHWRFKDIGVEDINRLYLPGNIDGNSLISGDGGFRYYNTEWCWTLIEEFGFELGKSQNMDRIKNNIPSKYVVHFEEGLKKNMS